MNDTGSKSDDRARARIAAAVDYEIDYLVVKTGITREQACVLVKKYGYDRDTLMKQARKLSMGSRVHLPFPKPSASGNEFDN